MTELDNVLYIIIALVNIKTKFETKLEVEKKIHNPHVSFGIVTFTIYSNNNGNIPEFFSFQNVTSPPHAVNVPFISSHIKVSMSSLESNLLT